MQCITELLAPLSCLTWLKQPPLHAAARWWSVAVHPRSLSLQKVGRAAEATAMREREKGGAEEPTVKFPKSLSSSSSSSEIGLFLFHSGFDLAKDLAFDGWGGEAGKRGSIVLGRSCWPSEVAAMQCEVRLKKSIRNERKKITRARCMLVDIIT